MPWRERYTLLSFILALSTALITQFFLRDWKHVNFDQILRVKMAELPLPENKVQMAICSTLFEQHHSAFD